MSGASAWRAQLARGIMSRLSLLGDIDVSDTLIVVLAGLPGAGKSTLAAWLCKHFGLVEVNRDRIRLAMFPSCRFSDAEKAAAHMAALTAVETNCELGRSSVVDGATFSRRTERDALRALASARGAQMLVLWLDCPVDVAAARVAGDTHAQHPAGDRDTALVASVARRFEHVDGAVRIDASRSPEAVRDAALVALQSCGYLAQAPGARTRG